jgi:hypothetical protein
MFTFSKFRATNPRLAMRVSDVFAAIVVPVSMATAYGTGALLNSLGVPPVGSAIASTFATAVVGGMILKTHEELYPAICSELTPVPKVPKP